MKGNREIKIVTMYNFENTAVIEIKQFNMPCSLCSGFNNLTKCPPCKTQK
jgi:hypothetical protein